jgi:hypothetical protein
MPLFPHMPSWYAQEQPHILPIKGEVFQILVRCLWKHDAVRDTLLKYAVPKDCKIMVASHLMVSFCLNGIKKSVFEVEAHMKQTP